MKTRVKTAQNMNPSYSPQLRKDFIQFLGGYRMYTTWKNNLIKARRADAKYVGYFLHTTDPNKWICGAFVYPDGQVSKWCQLSCTWRKYRINHHA